VITAGAEVADLGDRVLSPAPGAETVTDRLEIRLEDRLQDQHQRGLHQPVHRRRNAEPSVFPRLPALGNHAFPDWQRGERARLQLLPRLAQEGHDVGIIGDERRDHPVHPRGARPLIPPHPFPRDREEIRVINEVEQIIEPAARILGRPKVQLGLHPQYPLFRRVRIRPDQRLTSIHQCLQPLQYVACLNPLGPFAMCPPLASPDYYGPSAPPRSHRRTTRQPAPARPGGGHRTGTTGRFPRSPRTDRWVRWPALPQRHRHGYAADIHRGLPASFPNPARESPAQPGRRAPRPSPYLPDLSWCVLLRGFRPPVPRVHLPFSLDGPAPSGSPGTSRRCRGCLPPSPSSPGSGCPQLRHAAATA